MTDNKDLQISEYKFKGFSVRSGLDQNGNIWFVAKDVCNVLELNNVGQAVSRLDSEDKSDIFLNDVTGRFQSMLIISEAGLYQLVMTSEKKEAKTFKSWVLHVVLPEIRKKGYYGSPKPKYVTRVGCNVDRIESGYFSVIEQLSYILGGRVEVPNHITMRDKSITPKKDKDGKLIYPDICPDISVGKLFPQYLQDNYPEYADCFKMYSHRYPDGREVSARQYENKVLGIFKNYVELIWLKENAPDYFSKKDPKMAEALQKQLK